jgi:hypothetical protein
MAPITLQRLVQELDELKPELDGRRPEAHVRMIQHLRARGLSADRAAATAALAEALKRGVVTVPVEAPLRR